MKMNGRCWRLLDDVFANKKKETTMKSQQNNWWIWAILAFIVIGLVVKISVSAKRQKLYDEIKQFDNDVKRGRYTPVEVPGGVRYQKNW